MNELISQFQTMDIPPLIVSVVVSGVLSFILGLVFRNFIPQVIKKIWFSIKNKHFPHDQIIGKYFGYYLHKDTPKSEAVLRDSNWEISADYEKEHYNIVIYHNNPLNNKKTISYKGKMWMQEGHYLLQFDSQEYKETIFERRVQITKANQPIVGISLAITTRGRKIRANISVLSRKQLTRSEFDEIVKDYKVVWEQDTNNLIIDY